MRIEAGRVVTLEYEVIDSKGTVVEAAPAGSPLVFLHGTGTLLPAFEERLVGIVPGEDFEFVLEPEEAHGPRDERLVEEVPLDEFGPGTQVTAGMQFETEDSEGRPRIVTVVRVQADRVTIDANPPLAGETLSVRGRVLEVREATANELERGLAMPPR